MFRLVKGSNELNPYTIFIHGAKIEIYSVFCVLAAIFSITLPFSSPDVEDVDKYSRALLILLGKWSAIISGGSAYTPSTFCVMRAKAPTGLTQSTFLDHIFVFGTTKGGPQGWEKWVWSKSREESLQYLLAESSLCEGLSTEQLPRGQTALKRITPWTASNTGQRSILPIGGEEFKNYPVTSKDKKYKKRFVYMNIIKRYLELDGKLEKDDITSNQSFGDCAETWGFQVMARIARPGLTSDSSGAFSAVITSNGISEAEKKGLIKISDNATVNNGPKNIIACQNCTWLASAIYVLFKKVIIDDAVRGHTNHTTLYLEEVPPEEAKTNKDKDDGFSTVKKGGSQTDAGGWNEVKK